MRLIKISIMLLVMIIVASCTPAEIPVIITALPSQTATANPSPTPIPSQINSTPLSTLSPTQVLEIVRNLYTNNGGCELPCLWGVVPGKTSIQDVQSRFSEIGYFEDYTRSVDAFQVIYFTTVPPNNFVSLFNDGGWGFSMRVKNDIVLGFVTGATDIEEFSVPTLASFLDYFGRPEEIWIQVIESMSSSENPDYVITLYYPSKGVFISWRGETESVVTQTENSIAVIVCPQYMPTEADTLIGSYPPFFYLFSPDEKMPFDEIIKTHLSEDPGGSYQPLDNADLEKFYTMYLDPNIQDCFPLFYP